jgi:thioredoxin reductase (NADPH)
VTLVVRSSPLGKRMSDYLVQQILATPNIDVRLGAEVVGGTGTEELESLKIRDRESSTVDSIPATLLFVLIGASPHTEWLAGAVERDAKGFLVTGHQVDPSAWALTRPPMSFETSVPGVFAVGDVRLDSMKRVAAAVGEGASAVQNVHEYLEEAAKAAADGAREPAAPTPTPTGASVA